jgi:hypothetical protein
MVPEAQPKSEANAGANKIAIVLAETDRFTIPPFKCPFNETTGPCSGSNRIGIDHAGTTPPFRKEWRMKSRP